MAPFKSSLSRSAAKLLSVSRERDLSLRGATQSFRTPPPPPLTATGGTKIPSTDSGNGYTYHVFLQGTSDNFVADAGEGWVEVLIIGGGGGGGYSYYAGGGGAGGIVHGTNIPVTPGTYPITVGNKGTMPATYDKATNGGNSAFNSVTALGGGGGFGGPVGYPGSASGGSGGGGHGYPQDASSSIVKAPQPVPGDFTAYGSPGGLGTPYAGGGGGGATAAGGNAAPRGPGSPANFHFGGLGGAGKAFPGFPGPIIAPAIPTTNITDVPVAAGGPGPATERAAFTAAVGPTGLYGGGGGGGLYYTIGPDPSASGKPAGGTGGGADGAGSEKSPVPAPTQSWDIGPARKAVMHTGGGGGGGNYAANCFGSDGATGIILVRYQES